MSGGDAFASVDAVVFDLDGTLADSFEDIQAGVNHVLSLRGLPPLPLDSVMRQVGRGAAALLEGTMGPRDAARAAEDLRVFKEFYGLHLLDRTRAYPGALAAVAALAGRRRAVLSNKPESLTRAIVGGLGFLPHLDGAWGGDSFPAMKPDPAALLSVLDRLATPPDRALMVGDSDVDTETAARAGVRSVRVHTGLWRTCRRVPDAEVDTLSDLAERLDSAPR